MGYETKFVHPPAPHFLHPMLTSKIGKCYADIPRVKQNYGMLTFLSYFLTNEIAKKYNTIDYYTAFNKK